MFFCCQHFCPFLEAYLVSVAVFPVFRVNKREQEEANECRELAKATYRGAAPPFDACAPPFNSCAPSFDFCAPSFKCPLKSSATCAHFGKTVRRPALALALRPGQPSWAALESACMHACMYLVVTITQVSQLPDSNFCCSARRGCLAYLCAV